MASRKSRRSETRVCWKARPAERNSNKTNSMSAGECSRIKRRSGTAGFVRGNSFKALAVIHVLLLRFAEAPPRARLGWRQRHMQRGGVDGASYCGSDFLLG